MHLSILDIKPGRAFIDTEYEDFSAELGKK